MKQSEELEELIWQVRYYNKYQGFVWKTVSQKEEATQLANPSDHQSYASSNLKIYQNQTLTEPIFW